MEIIQIAGDTDIGLRRKDNQDTFICSQLWSANDALLAVIDGVGGYAGGDVAARIAKDSIAQYMSSPKGDTLTMLREAVVFVNNKIVEEKGNDSRLSQMCCVLTAAVADAKAQKLFFVHVGDTRLYRYRDGMLTKLSKDHSLVGIREDAGDLTETEAMNHPRRNEILREAGSIIHRIDDNDFLDYEETDFQPGDLILICSDGLSDMLDRAQMAAILMKGDALERKVRELIALANKQGGNDNITLVLAKNLSPVMNKADAAGQEKNADISTPGPEEAEQLMAIPLGQQAGMTTLPGQRKRIILSAIAVILILAAGMLWFRGRPAYKDDREADSSYNANSSLQTPGRDTAKWKGENGRPGLPHIAVDTSSLSAPQVLSDSSVIKHRLIKPADSSGNRLAFHIKKNSNVVMEHVTISGFSLGITMEENVKLQLKNVQFKSVATPVSIVSAGNGAVSGQINFISTLPDSTTR